MCLRFRDNVDLQGLDAFGQKKTLHVIFRASKIFARSNDSGGINVETASLLSKDAVSLIFVDPRNC